MFLFYAHKRYCNLFKPTEMNARTFVLLYGRDPQLLETRGWILETIGYRSQTASRPEEFESSLGDTGVALIIICHSIPAAETEAVIAAAHRKRPDLKILVLVATSSIRLRKTGERTLDVQEGPGPLIEAVRQLMDGRGSVAARQLSHPPEVRVMHLPVVPRE
jgi:hypothetical protein